MPGYIIHLTEAEMILKALRKKGLSLDKDFEEVFLLGALLPDTKRKKEKVTSHYWREEDLDKLAIPVHLKTFEEKYSGQIQGPLMFGCWAHLHLDERFVKEFWPSMMMFLGEDGQEKVKSQDIISVWLKKQSRTVPVSDFFSSAYYYGDYDRTNRRYYEQFQLHIPVMKEGITCPVKEVKVEDLKEVLKELNEMMKRDRTGDMELQVIPEEELLAFLEQSAYCAADQICKWLTGE